ncbi:MAG: MEDS domain-containing protein [bacterium]|nr:MEDS domain-containing protein [bacterium]
MEKTAVKKTENNIISDIPWGTHLCHFYQNKKDLIDVLVPYFKTGLKNNEFCILFTSEPVICKEGEEAIRNAVPDFDKYLEKGQIEIIFHDKWYIENDLFNIQRISNIWINKLNQALLKGYDGMRLINNPAWLARKDWKSFVDYEDEVNKIISEHQIKTVCAYSLDKCDQSEIVKIVSRHQFTLIKEGDKWEYIKNDGYKQVETKIQQNYDDQIILNKFLHLSQTNMVFNEYLEHTIDIILSIPCFSSSPRGCIFLIEDNTEILVMKAGRNIPSQMLKACSQVPLGKCLCGQAALTRKIQFSNCIDKRHSVMYKAITPHGHYCVPIIYDNKVLGVLNLHLIHGHIRNQKEENFLQAIADTLAGVIVRKKDEEQLISTLGRLREAINGTIQAIVSTVETRDPYTAGHQRRVSDLARSIAKEMCLSEKQIDGIRIAGSVHDLGKISVPSEILTKPGKITDMEFNIIKTHPQTGYNILKNIDFPWPIAQIILQHHERENGSGYPGGIKGKDILLEAKIIAVADVVEAMASHRPYRASYSIKKALKEIASNKGILYDPDVVDICQKLFTEKKFKLK